MYMSFPIKLIGTYFFVNKTQRKKISLSMNDIMDLLLALSVAAWVFMRYYLAVNDNANQFMNYDPSTYSKG